MLCRWLGRKCFRAKCLGPLAVVPLFAGCGGGGGGGGGSGICHRFKSPIVVQSSSWSSEGTVAGTGKPESRINDFAFAMEGTIRSVSFSTSACLTALGILSILAVWL